MSIMEIRNFRDFFLLYNQITETCFQRCTDTFVTRGTTSNEENCINNCVQKFVNTNHRMMQVYAEILPVFTKKMIETTSAGSKQV